MSSAVLSTRAAHPSGAPASCTESLAHRCSGGEARFEESAGLDKPPTRHYNLAYSTLDTAKAVDVFASLVRPGLPRGIHDFSVPLCDGQWSPGAVSRKCRVASSGRGRSSRGGSARVRT
jgi:hypothetical protein